MSDCHTTVTIGWMLQGKTPILSIECGSEIHGLQLDTQKLILEMDGTSSIGELIAGADANRSKVIEDTCSKVGSGNMHNSGVFIIASGQTATVDVALEEPETSYDNGLRLYFGEIVGTNETSMLIVKETGSGNGYMPAGNYTWDVTDSTWKSTFIVTFDANYEGGDRAFQSIDGTSAVLTANTFEREGYTFLGWNTEADGTGESYSDGASFTVPSGETGITLYAQWKDPVAEIGDTLYTSLSEALSDAQEGDTITLNDDITESITIPSGKDITIDLNGHTLKNAESTQNNGSTLGNHTITVEKGATLTVRDSSTEGTGTVDCLTHARAAVYNLGTFTLESGTLTRSAEASKSPTDNGGNSWYVVFNGGDMTFDGGYVHQNGFLSSLVINRSVDGSEATMTINGGKFEQPNFTVIKNEVSMTITDGEFIGTNEQSVQNWGDAKIDGGDFYGNLTSITMGTGDGATESAMDITGGDIVGDVIAWNYHTTDTSADNSPKITIGGDTSVEGSLRVCSGTFNQETESDDAVIEVSGGRFSQEVDDRFLAPGFAPVKDEDGNYVVGSVTPEITLDTTIIIGFIGGTESYIDIAAECNVSGNVTWESTDASVVTVSDGRITFVGPGWAYVHAWLTAESGKTDMATVEVAVTDVSDLEGLTFSAVTDDTLYRIMDDWYDAIESLEGWNNQLNFVDVESESDTFTIPYDVFEPLGWAVTSDNHDDYDFIAIHFPDAGGYEILDVTDTDEGLTVTTTSGYSPFLFLYRETTGDSGDDSELPPFIPFPPEQGGDPVEVYPSGDSGSSDNGDDTLKVVAVAAAAVIAAILAIVLASTYRHD